MILIYVKIVPRPWETLCKILPSPG